MKVFTGKEFLDLFGALSRNMEQLQHIADCHRPCGHCGGIGWVAPDPLAPEPEMPEEIKDLLWEVDNDAHFNASLKDHAHNCIIVA